MSEDKLRKIYRLYVDNGLITQKNVSFDSFKNINAEQQSKIFDIGKSAGLFNTSTLEDFQSLWSVQPAEPEVAEPDLKKKEEASLESSLEGGFLDSQKFKDYTKAARELRQTARKNPDGTESTVKFAYGESDGKFVVYPTLFPNSKQASSNPEDWTELDGDKAFREAIKRNEIFEFDNEEDAKKFALGSWKQNNDYSYWEPNNNYSDWGPTEFKKLDPSEQLASEESRSRVNTQYLEGPVGDFVNNIPYFGEIIDDFARATQAGIDQNRMIGASNDVLIDGANSSDKDIQEMIEYSQKAAATGPSDGMINFDKDYEEAGGGVWGFLSALSKNPSIAPEVVVTSLIGMTNREALAAGLSVIGTAVAGGAVAGGGIPGAVVSGIGSIPFAIAAAGAVTDAGMTFNELIMEELGDRPMTIQNVREIISDPDKLSEIRTKAIKRGATIGVIDAFTGKLGGTAVKTIGRTSRVARQAGNVSALGIEMTGGGLGEFAGQKAAGQSFDLKEIGLEAIGEGPMAVPNILSETLRIPKITINGESRTEADLNRILEDATWQEVAAMDINITNDPQGQYSRAIRKIVTEGQIYDEVEQANPDLTSSQIYDITEKEVELKRLEGKTSRSAQKKRAKLQSEIDAIIDAEPLEETEVVETVEETPTEEGEVRKQITPEEQEEVQAFFEESLDNEVTQSEETNKSLLKEAVRSQLGRLGSLIRRTIPNVELVFHETDEEYRKALGLSENDDTESGSYVHRNKGGGTIHINGEFATATTAAHEYFHALVMNMLSKGELGPAMKKMVASIYRNLPDGDVIKEKMQKHVKLYDEAGETIEIQSEEGLSELLGILAGEYRRLDVPKRNAVIEFLKDIARKIGISVPESISKDDVAVINMMNDLADLVTGKEQDFITESGEIQYDEFSSDLIGRERVRTITRPGFRPLLEQRDADLSSQEDYEGTETRTRQKKVRFIAKDNTRVTIDTDNLRTEVEDLGGGLKVKVIDSDTNTDVARLIVANNQRVGVGKIELAYLQEPERIEVNSTKEMFRKGFNAVSDWLRENTNGFISLGEIEFPTNKGKGIGQAAYRAVAEVLYEDYGLSLVSDTERSDSAQALWESLERKGLARAIGDRSERESYVFQYMLNDNMPDLTFERIFNIDGVVEPYMENMDNTIPPTTAVYRAADVVASMREAINTEGSNVRSRLLKYLDKRSENAFDMDMIENLDRDLLELYWNSNYGQENNTAWIVNDILTRVIGREPAQMTWFSEYIGSANTNEEKIKRFNEMMEESVDLQVEQVFNDTEEGDVRRQLSPPQIPALTITGGMTSEVRQQRAAEIKDAWKEPFEKFTGGMTPKQMYDERQALNKAFLDGDVSKSLDQREAIHDTLLRDFNSSLLAAYSSGEINSVQEYMDSLYDKYGKKYADYITSMFRLKSKELIDSPSKTMWHVTVAQDKIISDGKLKTRAEVMRDTSNATGLGGGPSDTISVTNNYDYANTVFYTLQTIKSIINGELSLNRYLIDASEKARKDIRDHLATVYGKTPDVDFVIKQMFSGKQRSDVKIPDKMNGLFVGPNIRFIDVVVRAVRAADFFSDNLREVAFIVLEESIYNLGNADIAMLQMSMKDNAKGQWNSSESELRVYSSDAFESIDIIRDEKGSLPNPIKVESVLGDIEVPSDIAPETRKQYVGKKGTKQAAKVGEDWAVKSLASLKTARELKKQGKTNKEILIETGWEQGIDLMWKFRIPPAYSPDMMSGRIERALKTKKGQTSANITAFIPKGHKILNMYPELLNYTVSIENLSDGIYGYQNFAAQKIGISNSLSPMQAASTFVHEVQHAIQHSEGFGIGAGSQHIHSITIMPRAMYKRFKSIALSQANKEVQFISEKTRNLNRIYDKLNGKKEIEQQIGERLLEANKIPQTVILKDARRLVAKRVAEVIEDNMKFATKDMSVVDMVYDVVTGGLMAQIENADNAENLGALFLLQTSRVADEGKDTKNNMNSMLDKFQRATNQLEERLALISLMDYGRSAGPTFSFEFNSFINDYMYASYLMSAGETESRIVQDFAKLPEDLQSELDLTQLEMAQRNDRLEETLQGLPKEPRNVQLTNDSFSSYQSYADLQRALKARPVKRVPRGDKGNSDVVRKQLTQEQATTIATVVAEGRSAGFRDSLIRDYLMRVLGYRDRDIKDYFHTSTDPNVRMPSSFGNITGGAEVGQKLFDKVRAFRERLIEEMSEGKGIQLTRTELKEKIAAYARKQRETYDSVAQIEEKVAKYKARLKKKGGLTEEQLNAKVGAYKTKKFVERDAERARANKKIKIYTSREITLNKKRKARLNENQIIDATIDFLEAQPEFQAEADTRTVGSKKKGTQKTIVMSGLSKIQTAMVSELQTYFGINPTTATSQRITDLRKAETQRRRGEMRIEDVKKRMYRLLKASIPSSKYGKSEVVRLLKVIEEANEENFDNLVSEVAQFVTKTENKDLRKKIKAILKGKYEKEESGRKKAVNISAEARLVIRLVNELIVPEGSEQSVFNEFFEKQEARMDVLNSKETLTDEEVREATAISIAMEMNTANMGMDTDTDVTKLLTDVLENLEQIYEMGADELSAEIEASKNRYNAQWRMFIQDVIGEEIDFSEDNKDAEVRDAVARMSAREENRRASEGMLRKFFRYVIEGFDTGVFATAEALDGLMDRISMLSGKMFGGATQQLVTERIDAASIEYKRQMLINEATMKEKMQEIFGKDWRSIARKNRKEQVEVAYKNRKLVEEAEAEYKKNPTPENLKKLNDIKLEQGIRLSQDQAYYLYNQFKDPANHSGFITMYGAPKAEIEKLEEEMKASGASQKDITEAVRELNMENVNRVMQEITDFMTPEVKQFADWQVDELFPSLYQRYNEVYRRIYRTFLPWNEHYAGRIYREGVDVPTIDLLSTGKGLQELVGANSTKVRIQNNRAIKPMNGTDVLASYLRDMEYFAAYAEPVNDIHRLINNPTSKNAIEAIHGSNVYRIIQHSVQRIANNGVDSKQAFWNKMFNSMNDIFILSRLAISPVIMLKQLTSAVTYMNDIGLANWLKQIANQKELYSAMREIKENSIYMQDRKNESIFRIIETYGNTGQVSAFIPNRSKAFMLDMLMWTTKFGDASAIYIGGAPNYMYYKKEYMKSNPTASEQEAIDYAIAKFERDTKRTQQSGDLQDKDFFQTYHPMTRAANMFLTTPKQYLRKEIQAIRSLSRKIKQADPKAGKGSILQNLRTFATYHVLMPVFFQWVASGMPGLLRDFRDDDDEDFIRASIIGNLNALFILGEIVTMAGDFFTDKPWAGKGSKSIGLLNAAQRVTQAASRYDKVKDPKKKEEAKAKLVGEVISTFGVPAGQMLKFEENYGKLLEGDVDDAGEAILRLFNYSEYQISGPKNKNEKKPKSAAELNAEYDKQKKKERKKNEGFSGGGF